MDWGVFLCSVYRFDLYDPLDSVLVCGSGKALLDSAQLGIWPGLVGLTAASIPIALFMVQLGFNVAWSILFFGLHMPGLAFGEIVILWFAILATTIAFWRLTPIAGYLLLPYLIWVAFATGLNFAIWRMNA
jgi:tryptophan-rich sensory protein